MGGGVESSRLIKANDVDRVIIPISVDPSTRRERINLL